ncbi:MAG: methyl-accepting chemotaxis protein [Chloroflexota bacterium]
MRVINQAFGRWGVAVKLTVLFVLFGVVPMMVIGLIAYRASLAIEDSVGSRFLAMAEGVADKIDRNLFERYGDVQAFGLNQVLDQKAGWYRAEAEENPISQVIDQYVDTYDLYSLSLLVDLEGRVIAVNSKDADGKAIQTQDLYKKNYSETAWFRALKAQQFTTTMPFAAPGNTVATGTYIEDLHVDADVKAAYPGDEGLTLGFSAPVYRSGKVVAYWSNRVKFSLVEDILRVAQQTMKKSGFPNSSVMLLGPDGKLFADYDPIGAGAEQFRHDFSTLFSANLADRGLTAAKGAIAGKSSFAVEPHPRTGVPHVIGYTHLKGALGYPGMNWSVLVLVDHAEASADAYAINRNVLIASVVCVAIILLVGILIGRVGVRGIVRVSEAVGQLAGGALETRVAVTSMDEVGMLAQGFNQMGEILQGKATAEQAHQATMDQFLSEAQRVLAHLAQGDLTDQVTLACEGDLAQIKGSINDAITNLKVLLTTVRETTESVEVGAEEITRGNEDISQRTSEQAASLEETSSAMEEMTATVKQNADNARQANQLAVTARDVAAKGGAVTGKAVEAMSEINKSSTKIADIITVIDEIAFQTNLLALNAAVEAARAGEHGRGFAVVAAEVRNLAQRSATAAKEIKGLIKESIQRVTDGTELVNQSGKTLQEIVTSVKRVTDIIAEITAASQEQAAGIDQVNSSIMQMDQTTQQNAALVVETTAASQSMREQAKALMQQVKSFKIGVTEVEKAAMPPVAELRKNTGKTIHNYFGEEEQASQRGQPPRAEAKKAGSLQPVGVAAGATRSRMDEEFEEF